MAFNLRFLPTIDEITRVNEVFLDAHCSHRNLRTLDCACCQPPQRQHGIVIAFLFLANDESISIPSIQRFTLISDLRAVALSPFNVFSCMDPFVEPRHNKPFLGHIFTKILI